MTTYHVDKLRLGGDKIQISPTKTKKNKGKTIFKF